MPNPLVQQVNEELENLRKELTQFKSTVEYLNNAKGTVGSAVQAVNQAEELFQKKVEDLKNTYTAFIKLSDAISGILQKIDTIDFPERLDNIETTVRETISYLNSMKQVTLDELRKASEVISEADFDGRFNNLQSSINASVSSNQDLANTINQQQLPEKIDVFERTISKLISDSYEEIERNTQQIASDTANSITDLNLPLRIDKLDANIAGILSAVQNVQSRLDTVERNIAERLNNSVDKLTTTLVLLQEKSNARLDKIENSMAQMAKKQQLNTYITWCIIVILTLLSLFFILKKG